MRPEKQAIVAELRNGLEKAAFVILTDYRGMKVCHCDDLRRRLAKLGTRFQVVKNSFLKLALSDNQRAQAADVMTSPTAVVVGAGDLVENAKVLAGFRQEQRVLAIKRGLADGRIYSPADMDALVKLPARPVLLGMLVGAVAAPMTHLAGVFRQKLAGLIYVIQAAQGKKEKQQ